MGSVIKNNVKHNRRHGFCLIWQLSLSGSVNQGFAATKTMYKFKSLTLKQDLNFNMNQS